MPEPQPSETERLEKLEKQMEQLRRAIELQRKIPPKPHDADSTIITVSLALLACFSGILFHRAVMRGEYPTVTELGAIGVAILLLRTDKATAADVSSAALRKILGISDTQQ